MTFYGNQAALDAFAEALASGRLHHAWLLAGPEGVGKASFARLAARRLLAEARGDGASGFDVPPGDRTQALIDAGAHPDFRLIERLPRDEKKPDQGLARSITVGQVRALQPLFGTKPTYSPARAVVIDAADDLERGSANALLKNLEEPPAGTVFLLVSHAPGRLLPTIRSRCRLLRFGALTGADLDRALAEAVPADETERAALAAMSGGSPGKALRHAGLDLAGLDRSLAVLAGGDPSNTERSRLASALAPKAAQARYEAFLARAPGFIAAAARIRSGEALRTALDAYDAARALAASALALSLDAQGTVFEMSGLVARLGRA